MAPRATISSQAALIGGVVVGGALEFAGDEFAAAPADVADVDLDLGGLRRQRRQPAVSDSLADAVVEDDVVEDLAVTFVESAAVEPERRRREPSHPHVVGRRQRAQLRQQAAIHSVAVMWYQMRLVDQHQVSRTEPGGVAPDALHPGENDRRVPFALADARAVDADGRVRPQREQGLEILLDQFEHMGHDQDSQCWIASRNVADQVRDDHALAGRGRHRCERIAATVATSKSSSAESASCWYGRSSNMIWQVAGALPEWDTGQFPHQRCACQGAGPAGFLGAAVAAAALVAGVAGLAGCSGSAGFVSSGMMREIRFLSG